MAKPGGVGLMGGCDCLVSWTRFRVLGEDQERQGPCLWVFNKKKAAACSFFIFSYFPILGAVDRPSEPFYDANYDRYPSNYVKYPSNYVRYPSNYVR